MIKDWLTLNSRFYIIINLQIQMLKKIEIDSNDIMKINGKSASTARKQIQDVKKSLKREKHQKVTIKEYCKYFGFDIDDVLNVLFKSKFNNAQVLKISFKIGNKGKNLCKNQFSRKNGELFFFGAFLKKIIKDSLTDSIAIACKPNLRWLSQ